MKTKLYLLNGPLGAGKTTLLRQLLATKELKDARIIENEFASVSIDTQTLDEHQHEVSTIAGTCICCGTGEELVEALHGLAGDEASVIIEATGVANSLRVIEKLVVADLLELYDIAHAVFVVDGAEVAHGDMDIKDYEQEIRAADTIVVSKVDLLSEEEYYSILDQLAAFSVTSVVAMKNGIVDTAFIAHSSQILERYASMAPSLGIEEPEVSYTVLDMHGRSVSIDRLKVVWEKLKTTHALKRMKGFVSDGKSIWHIEATPSQFAYDRSRNSDLQLVLIGRDASRISLEDMVV